MGVGVGVERLITRYYYEASSLLPTWEVQMIPDLGVKVTNYACIIGWKEMRKEKEEKRKKRKKKKEFGPVAYISCWIRTRNSGGGGVYSAGEKHCCLPLSQVAPCVRRPPGFDRSSACHGI